VLAEIGAPMTQYTPDTIEDLCKVLRGLSHRMKVEIEPGIPLAAKTLADLAPAPLGRPACA
jgi:hypothetical protein